MKKILTFLFFLYQIFNGFGQAKPLSNEEYNNSGAYRLHFAESISEATELARKDIENGNLFILLQSGICPIIYITDSAFQVKYNVLYHDYGCISPSDSLMIEYNFVVFDCLVNKFGNAWKKDIRKDSVGFKKWRRKHFFS